MLWKGDDKAELDKLWRLKGYSAGELNPRGVICSAYGNTENEHESRQEESHSRKYIPSFYEVFIIYKREQYGDKDTDNNSDCLIEQVVICARALHCSDKNKAVRRGNNRKKPEPDIRFSEIFLEIFREIVRKTTAFPVVFLIII